MRLFRPSDAEIQAFLRSQAQCGHTYAQVGDSASGRPPGFDLDDNSVCLGQGRAIFDAACEALRRWRQFPRSWTCIFPADTPLEPGRVVAMLARACGLWWLNACRIVEVIDELGPPRRFGFIYGTLPAHVECGEERFLIEWDADDSVWYDVRAFSRPRHPLVRLAHPVARRLQRRFVLDSQAAMQQLVACPGAEGGSQ
jgi:uncharacterized protein (UPF0548 family)